MLSSRGFCRVCSVLMRCYSSVSLQVEPSSALVDQEVSIKVKHLQSNQLVTLHAGLEENGVKFQSTAVYKADYHGNLNVTTDPAFGGSYEGVEPMGLFWALAPCPGQGKGLRLMKKDVSTPMKFKLKVFPDIVNNTIQDNDYRDENVLAQTDVERWFMKSGTTRIPVTEGPFRGTMFVPEGQGPFPGVVDMFGGLISLIETRAALLASKGYATFAISYIITDHLPKHLMYADPSYVVEACRWFNKQPFVISDRLAAVAVCFGGTMALAAATKYPKLQALVTINSLNFYPHSLNNGEWPKPTSPLQWPYSERVYKTSEGVVINDIFDCPDPHYMEAWQHGAKILCIVGEDDKQQHPKMHQAYHDAWPEKYRDNMERYYYPGAGHLIEPPYTPVCRVVNPKRKRMEGLEFVPKEMCDDLLMAGGYPAQHAHAQENAWAKTLAFLDKNMR